MASAAMKVCSVHGLLEWGIEKKGVFTSTPEYGRLFQERAFLRKKCGKLGTYTIPLTVGHGLEFSGVIRLISAVSTSP
jgi:hypothetical protein